MSMTISIFRLSVEEVYAVSTNAFSTPNANFYEIVVRKRWVFSIGTAI